MNRKKAGLITVAALAVVIGGYFGVPALARKSSYFMVRNVEMVGLDYLQSDEVLRALKLGADRSIVDPLDSVRARAAQMPGVAAASVERRFPGTLRVTILEEVPVALMDHDGQLVMVDHRGRPLKFDPARQATALPIVDTGVAAVTLLARVMEKLPDWYPQLDSAMLEDGDVVLRIGDRRIRLHPDADEETLGGVVGVQKFLADSAIRWIEMDARYKRRIIVKKDVT